jgi:hypothetical protein
MGRYADIKDPGTGDSFGIFYIYLDDAGGLGAIFCDQ